MLALTRFAWRTKVAGGQAAVDAIKAKTHEQEIPAGSQILENLGADTQPIKTDSAARNAYDDGRMIKLMFQASVGISEQYFADISTGNLATAKTVELPMMKMFKSNQKVWGDTYQDIDEVVLEHAGIAPDKWYVDREFPPIAPADVAQIAESIVNILNVLPQFADSLDVQGIAMQALGVNDPAQALDALTQEAIKNPDGDLLRAVKQLRETIEKRS